MHLFKFSFLLAGLIPFACGEILPAQTNAPVTNTPAPSGPREIVLLHDVVIGTGGGRDLHAEIAYPKDAVKSLPAVVYIHGGGWAGGTYKQVPNQSRTEDLARAGYFGASVEYRLSGEAKWPAQIEDCKLGVRWLRANAAKYHVDPNRIGVWGDSAGGHLVACLGTMADKKEYEGSGGWPGVSSAVQAVVDLFGPTDFTSPEAGAYGAVEQLFGVAATDNPDLWRSGSPVIFVKAGDPPTLIMHGDSDRTVPLEQSIIFDAALTKAGVPHQFVIVKNADHGFAPSGGATINPSGDEIHAIQMEFLAKYLKGP